MNYVCRVPWSSSWPCITNPLLFWLIFCGGACKRRGQSKCITEICLVQDDRLVPSSSVHCFCLCFVYSFENGSAAGWDLGRVGGQAPRVDSVGLANGRAQLRHTSSCLPVLLKRFSSCPLLLAVPSLTLSEQNLYALRADWALTTSEPNN